MPCRSIRLRGFLVLSMLVFGASWPRRSTGAQGAADPMQMIYACRDAYKSVKDFTAVLHRRERLCGKLQPEETILVKFRNSPFSVYMKWIAEPHRTREAIYIENQNDGKIVVHEVVSLFNWMRVISPDGEEAREESHHTIRESGIGKAIESLVRVCEAAKEAGDLNLVYAGQDSFDNRPADLLIRVLPQKPGYPYHIIRLQIDRQLNLPVRFVSFNWDSDVETIYGYTDVKLNVGLTGQDFNYKNKEYGYQQMVGLRLLR